MSTLAADLRTQLLADGDITAAVAGRVHYQHVPQSVTGAYIWFARAGSSDDEDRQLNELSGQQYHFRELWDVEAISTSLSSAQSLALLVKKFDNLKGTLGAGSCQALFVRDHTEDYIPRGILSDEGSFAGSLQFEVIGYVPA